MDPLSIGGTVLNGGNSLGTVCPGIGRGPLISRNHFQPPDRLGVLLHRLHDHRVFIGVIALALPVQIVGDALHAALGNDAVQHVHDLLVIHADRQAHIHRGLAVIGHHIGPGAAGN